MTRKISIMADGTENNITVRGDADRELTLSWQSWQGFILKLAIFM